MNLKGEYNVPYGFREKEFLNEKTLLDVSNALQNAILRYGDFDLVRQNIKPNDLVFLDPPYTVSHNNNGFIKYNQKIFSLEDQIRLNSLIQYIKKLEHTIFLLMLLMKPLKKYSIMEIGA